MRPDVSWICDDCALTSGGEFVPGHVATYHIDKCGVCGKEVAVTETRDFRWGGEGDMRTECYFIDNLSVCGKWRMLTIPRQQKTAKRCATCRKKVESTAQETSTVAPNA